MTDVANLVARLRLDASGFDRGMARAASAAARFGGVAVGVAAGALAVFTARSFAAIDATAKNADRLGETTEKLAGYEVAAALAGISNERFIKSLTDGQRRIAEAAQGTGQGADALKQLGLSAARLVQLSPGAQLERVAEALQNVGNANERARLLYDLFGRSGSELINIIKGGAAAFDEAQAFANATGLAISRIDAAKIEEANDATTRVGFAMQGLGNQIGIRVAPFITEAANRFLGFATDGTRAAAAVNEGLLVVRFTVARVLDGIDVIRATFNSVVGAVQSRIATLFGLSAKLNDALGFDGLAADARAFEALFASNAEDSVAAAADALERLWSDDNQREVDVFFNNVEDRATAAATKVAALAAETAASTRAFGALERAGSEAKSPRARNSEQFDRRFINPRGLSATRAQEVRDPQLATTNSRLDEMIGLLRTSSPAVFT